jgi:hypothetical protein
MSNKGSDEITSKTSQEKPKGKSLRLLRAAALVALVVGAAGSLGFMFRAGQHTPRLLLILFTIWVLSPFVVLLWAITVSKRWSVLTRSALYYLTLIVMLGSLAIYGEWVHVKPRGSANAFLFVIIPPASLIFIAVVVSITALISGRRSPPDDGV